MSKGALKVIAAGEKCIMALTCCKFTLRMPPDVSNKKFRVNFNKSKLLLGGLQEVKWQI